MNLVNELRELSKKIKLDKNLKLRIILKDGDVVEGPYGGFTQALDNEPEIASLSISKEGYNIELYENEIKSIEAI